MKSIEPIDLRCLAKFYTGEKQDGDIMVVAVCSVPSEQHSVHNTARQRTSLSSLTFRRPYKLRVCADFFNQLNLPLTLQWKTREYKGLQRKVSCLSDLRKYVVSNIFSQSWYEEFSVLRHFRWA